MAERTQPELLKLTKERAFLQLTGSGMSFPFRFSDHGAVRSVELAQGLDKINQSIHLILSTRKGERVNRPTYGSNLPLLVFELNDDILLPLLRIETADALRIWENRITVTNIQFVNPSSPIFAGFYPDPTLVNNLRVLAQNENMIGIYIEYVLNRNPSQAGAYIYPFGRLGARLTYAV